MRPKQFIDLIGEQSLFQNTLLRISSIKGMHSPIVVCSEEHRFMVAEQMQKLGIRHNSIILESVGRNTAPAVASAAFKLSMIDGNKDAVMFVLPSDHLIDDKTGFDQPVMRAYNSAIIDRLVTFGVNPDHPSTGYGYIKSGSQCDDSGAYMVERFVEKPDRQTAARYLEQGDYFWNSGMFMFKASVYLTELESFRPDVYRVTESAVRHGLDDLDFFRLGDQRYEGCESISVDYAVMEKSNRVSMVPFAAHWSDVGSWSSLWNAGEKDASGNIKKGDIRTENVTNSYIHSENRLVGVIGVDDLIIVETHDAVMITARENDQDIKRFVTGLRKAGRVETDLHRKVFRPWGNYDCLDFGARFQVKRLTVKPGQYTSLQKHTHRAEHWIVVSGTAEVTCGDKTFILRENESTFIPLGEQHRLKNPGTIPLELIEVQSGSYLGEDDIERIDDQYGRS